MGERGGVHPTKSRGAIFLRPRRAIAFRRDLPRAKLRSGGGAIKSLARDSEAIRSLDPRGCVVTVLQTEKTSGGQDVLSLSNDIAGIASHKATVRSRAIWIAGRGMCLDVDQAHSKALEESEVLHGLVPLIDARPVPRGAAKSSFSASLRSDSILGWAIATGELRRSTMTSTPASISVIAWLTLASMAE